MTAKTETLSRKPTATKVAYRTVKIDGLDIFYREAGPKDAPVVLLLHGFPTSSHMFRNLIPALADEFHLVAPDYPGYGNSSMPTVDQFEYTFDHLAEVIEKFTEKVGLQKYTLYVMDYGAPVGYRLAVKHPERVQALVVQNGNAYDEGLDNDFWKPIKAYWQEKTAEREKPLRGFLHPRGHHLAIHRRRPGQGGDQPRHLEHRPAAARPAGERRDPARPVLQLRQQPAALPEMAGLFPPAPAADAHRLGEERPDLPRGRR